MGLIKNGIRDGVDALDGLFTYGGEIIHHPLQGAVFALGVPGGVGLVDRLLAELRRGGLVALFGLPQQSHQLGLPHAQVVQQVLDRPITGHARLGHLRLAQPVDGIQQLLALVFQGV